MMRANPVLLRRQQGMSLAELMIGMVLGLIIISAVLNTYIGSTRSSDFSRGIQYMQENGRYGMTTLQRGIRLAGYSPNNGSPNERLTPFVIADSNETTIVVQVADRYDCNGADTASVNGIAVNTYAHDPVAMTITCTGNVGLEAMPIVEGVEAMRILWGINADDDNVPDRYISYDAGIDADEVLSVRVAILVSSDDPIRSRAGIETHVLLDREIETGPDKIARNVFSSTIQLRNIASLRDGV